MRMQHYCLGGGVAGHGAGACCGAGAAAAGTGAVDALGLDLGFTAGLAVDVFFARTGFLTGLGGGGAGINSTCTGLG